MEGKVVIVTGAASGIGKACAKRFVAEGASMVLADRADLSAIAKRIESQGSQALSVEVDVSDEGSVVDLFTAVRNRFGRLDVLAHLAGISRRGLALDFPVDDWDAVIDTNLKGTFLCCRAAIPVMRDSGGGAIVNTASVHSLVSFDTCTAYDAAKAGLLGLTRVLALDYGPDIRVNAVLPGAILTPLWRGVTPKDKRRYGDMVPAKRLGTPEDVANAVLYLASDEASFVTGTTLVVDGGLLARTM